MIFFFFRTACHPYVIRMSFVCHPYVTRMYSYVIRMSLVCTHVSFVCHSYVLVCHHHSFVLVCHPYVTRMYSNVIRMSLVCGFTMNRFSMLKYQSRAFHLFDQQTFLTWVENIELWWIMGKQKKFSDENLRLDWIKLIHLYWLINIGWLADINLFNLMIYLFNHKL